MIIIIIITIIKGRNLLPARQPWAISTRREMMSQKNKSNKWPIMYWPTYSKGGKDDKEKNVAMAWIDFKKAYNMIPPMWIKECLKMLKITEQIVNFITKAMEN